MSNLKITPKNLSYTTTLPPFLQRLHNSTTATSLSLDGRHERAIARPKRARDADAEKEDEPVFVDGETGIVVSGEEFRALAGGGAETNEQIEGYGENANGGEAEGEEKTRHENEKEKEKEKPTAIIGASRKRKVVKVVGGGGSEEDNTIAGQKAAGTKAKREGAGKLGTKEKERKGIGTGKGKKVKLSFGDDEG